MKFDTRNFKNEKDNKNNSRRSVQNLSVKFMISKDEKIEILSAN
mgnify:CR=1 FL=1